MFLSIGGGRAALAFDSWGADCGGEGLISVDVEAGASWEPVSTERWASGEPATSCSSEMMYLYCSWRVILELTVPRAPSHRLARGDCVGVVRI